MSQTINITGTLIDRIDGALGGCDISLALQDVSTTSGASNGNFTLTGTAAGVFGEYTQTGNIAVEKGVLILDNYSLNNKAAVNVYDSQGRHLLEYFNENIPAGRTRVDLNGLPDHLRGNKLVILKIKLGELFQTVKLPLLDVNRFSLAGTSQSGSMKKKSSGVIDTVLISCDGLPIKKVRVESYSGTLGSIRVMQPNIVIVLADDLTRLDIGAYGSTDVLTPNIDQLAQDGKLFERAFTATAMCSPTRQQMYTGLYPVRSGAYPNHTNVKQGTRSVVHYLNDLGYRVGLSGKRHFGPADSFPFEIGGDIDWAGVEDFITGDNSQPYMLFITSRSPHWPWSVGDAGVYDPDDFTLRADIGDTPVMRDELTRYYAEITDLDGQVGRTLDLVDQSGLKDNTLFIFTSEQGSQIPGAKWSCYDLGLQVGFIARWPAEIEAGSTTPAMVNYVDVVPTLIAAAGGDAIDSLDGRSFLPVLMGESNEHDKIAYGVHTQFGAIGSPETGYPIRSVRTETHKYIWNINYTVSYSNWVVLNEPPGYASWLAAADSDTSIARLVNKFLNRPEFELYDITIDPLEQQNLAGLSQHQPLMDSLQIILDAWMLQQGDLGMETELGGGW